MNEFTRLIDRTESSVNLQANIHKDFDITIDDVMEGTDYPDELVKKMNTVDRVLELTYFDKVIGRQITLFGTDIDKVVAEAHANLDKSAA